jgi:CheY-like chemotaxis protein
MGGTIRATSSEGNGSTFSFTLPLKPEPCEEIQQEADESPRPLRVLLAEDDPLVRDLVKLMLSRLEVEVAVAENGREAVECWREGGVDLILMDLQMPEMDGIEATRKIREFEKGRESRTCIFALTAHARREDREECLAAGMDGFMTKPLRMAELRSMIEDCPYILKSRLT